MPEIHGAAEGLVNVEGWAMNVGSGQRMGGSGQRVKKLQRVHFVGKGVISLGKENLLISEWFMTG